MRALAAIVVLLGGAVASLSPTGDRAAEAPVATTQVAPPPPGAPLPPGATALARALQDADAQLAPAIDTWAARGGGPPRDVARLALYVQRIQLRLVRAPRLYASVLRRIPPRLRAATRRWVLAKRELARIHSVVRQRPRIRVGRAEAPERLLAYYRRAQQRFGVRWSLLAAVNYVESAFGRLRNESVSGARGPMQFMPATWRAYGLGGDVHDPRDAILGAANYLHANGAPGNETRALYHYNPSRLYVRAVLRFARAIGADRRAFFSYYAQQVFVRTSHGYRRVSSFGL